MNKLATIDTANAISNAQLVPDLTNSAATGFSLYLVVTFKLGTSVYIQQIDDSLTFSTSALSYHSGTSPVYVDSSLNNHKIMVQATFDSYYLLVNFKQFFQTGANVKIESVIFK